MNNDPFLVLHDLFRQAAALEKFLDTQLKAVAPDVRAGVTLQSSVTIRDIIILNYVERSGGSTIPNIKANAFSKQNPNPLVNTLVREGLLSRDKKEGHHPFFRITEKGADILVGAREILSEYRFDLPKLEISDSAGSIRLDTLVL